MDSDETRKMDLEVLDKLRGTTLQYIKFYSTRFPYKDNSSNTVGENIIATSKKRNN